MNVLKSTLVLVMMGAMATVNAQSTAGESNAADMAMNSVEASPNWETNPPTIAGVASGNEAFSTLVAALKAADLVSVLDGDGPFTVFAPTNDAFAKLPEGTVSTLLQSENIPTLTKILTYHVVAGEFKAADVVKAIEANNNAFTVKTVAGEALTLSIEGGSVILTDVAGNTSKVTATDVDASNGVIHVIDTVVMPQ